MYVETHETSSKLTLFSNMRFIAKFITAVCVLFLRSRYTMNIVMELLYAFDVPWHHLGVNLLSYLQDFAAPVVYRLCDT